MRIQITTVLIALALTLACAAVPSPTSPNTVVKANPHGATTENSTSLSSPTQQTEVPTTIHLEPTSTETSQTVRSTGTQASILDSNPEDSAPAGSAPAGSAPAAAAPGTSAALPSIEAGDKGLRFLALGDSYTIGESVSLPERWPVQLAQLIRNQGIKIAEPMIVAKTGWTTTDLAAEIRKRDIEGTFDLVTLMIGVNNQFRHLDLGKYRGEFLELLDTSLGFAGGKKSNVVVVSIPDYGVTPFAALLDGDLIASEIDQYTDINREEANKAGIAYVDITGISREAKTDLTLVAADGLHPSGKMYSLWAKEIHSRITSNIDATLSAATFNATLAPQATLFPTPMPAETASPRPTAAVSPKATLIPTSEPPLAASPPPNAGASPTYVPAPINVPTPEPFIQPEFGTSVGDTLPHFEFTLIDGTVRSTAQLSSQGRPVFLFFFAAW